MTHFAPGKISKENLEGVHPDLVRVVMNAYKKVTVDMRVYDGVRTEEEAETNFKSGVSRTKNTQHRIQKTGFGHAVDLVPIFDHDGDGDTELVWDWPGCYKIAKAMREAAIEERVIIIWGGVWDCILNELSSNTEREVMDYVTRRKSKGKDAFIDGPHFELSQAVYNV